MRHYVVAVGLVLLFAANALAEANLSSCRCPTKKIIQLGDSSNKVLRLCGEPDLITEIGSSTTGRHWSRESHRGGSYWIRGRYKEVTRFGENWEYNMGRLKYPLILTIAGARVIKITLADQK
jgi:hypothetical protein